MKAGEILAGAVAIGALVGIVEWRVQAAMDEPAAVEERLTKQLANTEKGIKGEIALKDEHAKERSAWFREEHKAKNEQMKRIEQKLDFMIMRLVPGSVNPGGGP